MQSPLGSTLAAALAAWGIPLSDLPRIPLSDIPRLVPPALPWWAMPLVLWRTCPRATRVQPPNTHPFSPCKASFQVLERRGKGTSV